MNVGKEAAICIITAKHVIEYHLAKEAVGYHWHIGRAAIQKNAAPV